jgi:membrane-associated PAP2 superfamily phosphatase
VSSGVLSPVILVVLVALHRHEQFDLLVTDGIHVVVGQRFNKLIAKIIMKILNENITKQLENAPDF